MSQGFAFVFPGQGSQKVAMLASYYENKIFKDTFVEAGECLGYDLLGIVKEGPQEKLNLTEITQPLLLSASVALWRIWKSQTDNLPTLMAGHSLGEWSALVCAEVLSFTDALSLVQSRGKYMQEAVPLGEGAMAAILGLGDEAVEKICASLSTDFQVCAPVNYNSPGQLVIAGHKGAIDAAVLACKEAGAKRALPLPVSAPFHTSLMRPAADKLAEEIKNTKFSSPAIAVVHNVSGATEQACSAIKDIMVEQVYSPVRWVDCVKKIHTAGVSTLVECGPGKVLSGLNKRIDKEITSLNTDTEAAMQIALNELIQP